MSSSSLPNQSTHFVINKTIMKYPLRNESSRQFPSKKNKNTTALISKKYQEIDERLGDSPRTKVLEEIRLQLKDNHANIVKSLKKSISSIDIQEKATTRNINQINQHRIGQLRNLDVKITETSEEQSSNDEHTRTRLRNQIYSNLSPTTVEKIYNAYQQRKMMAGLSTMRFSDDYKLDEYHTKLNRSKSMGKDIDNKFLSQVLLSDKFDAEKILGVHKGNI